MAQRLAPTLKLQNGVEIPQLGLGTWPMDDAQAAAAVRQAIGLGYRLIDTAENYGNETGVGQGVKASGVARGEIFITTKFNRQWHSQNGVREAALGSMKRLGVEYIDLLLIHWPNPGQGRYLEAYEALTRLLEEGLVRAIGVSNFKPAHLQTLFDAGFVPHLNQVQLDPYRQRRDIVAIHKARGIVTETWSPIDRNGALLEDAFIKGLAAKYGKTPAQIVLRLHVQSGYATTPKSADPARQAQNLDIFSFALTDEEFAALNALDNPAAPVLDSDAFGH
ncbi:aldo/keto reductase [Acidocella sp.]|uniref:aldo/keto reductase n=1 Tax=Acidocella sp. TaxID=50710 RepID=UPI0026297016|nr:aldo/keto reductase [Acidocella sp.]